MLKECRAIGKQHKKFIKCSLIILLNLSLKYKRVLSQKVITKCELLYHKQTLKVKGNQLLCVLVVL